MKEINIRDVKENLVTLIANDWALLTAKNENGCSPMTISWGGIGELWGKDIATIFIRENRYTRTLIDKEDYFSLCFFDDDYKDVLMYCGEKSGKKVDKVKETGITPLYDENAPYFKEAKLVLVCKKIAYQRFDEKGFVDPEINTKWYADNNMHYMYFAEIEKVLISE